MSDRDASDAFVWLDSNAESSLEAPDPAFGLGLHDDAARLDAR